MVDEGSVRPRACGECAKAKAKCSLDTASSPETVCDRCSRLKKSCVLQDLAPRKRKRVGSERTSRNHGDTRRSLPITSDESAHSQAWERMPWSTERSRTNDHKGSTTEVPARSKKNTLPSSQDSENATLNDTDDDRLLAHYCANMEPNFPFVLVSRMQMSELKVSSPLVYRTALLAAANRDVDHALAIENDVLKYIAEHVVVQGERTLDTLQGLLILVAFYHFHIRLAKQVTTMMQIAVSVLSDLGLSRPESRRSDFEAQIRDGSLSEAKAALQSRDEMRAYCGCYYLASIVSGFFHKTEPMRSTMELEESCRILEDNPASISDRHAVHLVRLQQFRMKFSTPPSGDRVEATPSFSLASVSSIRALQSELATLKRNAPIMIMTQGVYARNALPHRGCTG